VEPDRREFHIMKNTFIEKKPDKQSLYGRKLRYGIGVNDAQYMVYMTLDGAKVMCPYYRVWGNMLQRCYSEKFQAEQPSYIGCSIDKRWHKFSAFKEWMMSQQWEGKELDKDVLQIGNKIYSPETCVFVSRQVNAVLTYGKSNKGKLPPGVSFDKKSGKYKAVCNIGAKYKHLGYFPAPEQAEKAYKKAKRADILRHANLQSDDRIRQGLIRHADFLINEVAA